MPDFETAFRAARWPMPTGFATGGSYFDLAQVLIARACQLYINEPFYVMDKGYLDFGRLYRLTQKAAYFVIRAKTNQAYRRQHSHRIDKTTGLRSDQTILLTGPLVSQKYPHF